MQNVSTKLYVALLKFIQKQKKLVVFRFVGFTAYQPLQVAGCHIIYIYYIYIYIYCDE